MRTGALVNGDRHGAEQETSAPGHPRHDLVCPACLGVLEQGPDALTCAGCLTAHPTADGIFDFGVGPGAERDPSRSNAATLLEDPFLADDILDKSRAGWVFHCLRTSGNLVCVVLGSGWGGAAFTLAEHFERVWSVEPGWEQLRFQTARKAEEGRANVHLVRASVLRLPVPSGSADLIVVNGADFARGPEDRQRALLKEVHRILGPGGCLFVGVENRFGLSYRRLFRESGFQQIESYWAWRDHRIPRVSGTFEGAALRYFLRVLRPRAWNWRKRLAAALARALPSRLLCRVAMAFWPSVLVFAYKEGPPEPERLQDLIRLQSEGTTGMIRISTPRACAPKQTYLLLRGQFVEKAVSVVTAGHPWGTAERSAVRRFVQPAGKFRLSVAEGVKGFPLDPARPDHTELAIAWLLEFQGARRRGAWLPFELRREVDEIVALIEAQPGAAALAPLGRGLADAYLGLAGGVKLWGTPEHGDFQYRNILLNRDGRLVLLDWDDFRARGNPLLDVGTYLWMLADGQAGRFASMLRGQGPVGRSFRVSVSRYSAGSGLPEALVVYSIPYAILRAFRRDALPVSAGRGKRIIRPSILLWSQRFLETFREVLGAVRRWPGD